MHKQIHFIFFTLLFSNSIYKAICSNNVENDEKSHSTSIAGMTQLLKVETELITNLDNYASLLQDKVDIIRSALKDLRNKSEKYQNDTEAYLSNPLSGFSLIRRMYSDWINWQLYMEQPVGEDQINFIQNMRSYMPTTTDLNEAVSAIHRLQATYDLKAKDIANGLLNGKQYDIKLSPLDRFAIGLRLFDMEKYLESSLWLFDLIETYRHSNVTEIMGLDFMKTLQIYATTLLKLSRQSDAIKVLDIALTIRPNDANLLRRRSEIDFLIKTEPSKPITHNKPKVSNYERGCRGEFKPRFKLYCRYNTSNSAFLKIAPLKLEEVSLDPYIIIYREVMYPSEILDLQNIARPILKRATVYNTELKKNLIMETRTSKVAWLHDNFNPTVVRINTRITDMTRFNMEGSEMLQVMNYGLGGHYDLHFDFFNGSNDFMRGNRIATVLFYLNDVDQGGATVFPHIETAVFPQKGSAIVWYNLNNAGEGDWRTMHAACPVIVGSKWVANKWIRERQQLFTKPCLKNTL